MYSARCVNTVSLWRCQTLSHDRLQKSLSSLNWLRLLSNGFVSTFTGQEWFSNNGHLPTSTGQESGRLGTAISIIQKIQEAVWNKDDFCESLCLQVRPYHVNEVLKGLHDARFALRVFEWAKALPGFKHDKFNYTLMIGILGKSGDADAAKQLFEEMLRECQHVDIYAFNNLLKTYASMNRHDEVLALYRNLKIYGFHPDKHTFTIVIDSLGKDGRLSEAKAFYKAMQRAGWRPDKYVFTSLIHNLGKWGYTSSAMKCFAAMKKRGISPSSITYSTLIDMHSTGGDITDALDLYKEYRVSKLEQDLVVYNSIMHVLGKCGRTMEAEWVYSDIQRAGLCADVYTYCILVSSRGREGDTLEAHKWFEKMLDNQVWPNVPICNAMINAYTKEGMFSCIGDVLSCMHEKWGLVPTLQTYTSLLSLYTYCNEEELDIGRNLMRKSRHPADDFVDKILCWKGQGKELQDFARSGFQKMQVKAFDWTQFFANVLVNHLCLHAYMLEAHHVWEAVLESKLYPQDNLEQNGNCWNIFLLNMKGGTALVALTKTLIRCKWDLHTSHLEVPARVVIIISRGKNPASLLFRAVDDMLRHLESPFKAWFGTGTFMCDGKDFKDWLGQSSVATETSLEEFISNLD